jgi:hypothetical protein
MISSEKDSPEDYNFNHVAAGVAVLAAIAASDALCCRLLGERSRSQDHRDAVDLVATVRFGAGDEKVRERRSRDLADALATALDLKDESHYGAALVGQQQVKRLLRAAGKLVDAATQAVG